VRGSPELHYHLPARLPGSFGTSGLARAAESLTLTWSRFEVFLVWLILVPVILASPSESVLAMLGLSVLSPIGALAIWVLLKLTGWVFYFVPGVGRLWGWGRIIFLWVFSRLVVQPAPTIDLPAWGVR
jgi:hypothetical protein